MKYTLKCPKCLNVFTFSEENDNYAFCECGWEFKCDEYIGDFVTPSFEEVFLEIEDEEFDLIWQIIDSQTEEMKPQSGGAWLHGLMWNGVEKYLKESKFKSIPQDELNSLDNLIKQINLVKLRIYRNNKVSGTKIGLVRVSGTDIPVYIGRYAEAQYRKYKSGYSIVVPYGDDLDESSVVERIRNDIYHEIGHILDIKVSHPEFTAKNNERYKELLEKPELTDAEKLFYSKFPPEVDAIGTQFDSVVRDNFKNVDYKSKLKVIEKIKEWLKYSGDNLPFFQPEVVRAWRTKPTLYRKFQKKVYNLVQELEQLLKGD
jgi:hypothetical protein